MRLLFVSALFAPEAIGGAELTLEPIVQGMAARGHTVAVLTTGRADGDNTLASGVLVMRRRIANLYPIAPTQKRGPVWRAAWQLLDSFNVGGFLQVRAAIRRFRPDVVVSDSLRGFSVAAWPAASLAGIPIVHRVCDAYLLSPSLNMLFARPGSPTALLKGLVRWPHRKLTNSVSRVIGLSDAIVDLHRRARLFENSRSIVIPTAVEVCPLQRTVGSGPLRLGFIGQLIPTKGIEDLLMGFVAANVDATLDVAGSGDAGYVALLKQRFNDPRIRFVGWVSDKRSFFSHIDLCLVPSRIFDTLPTVVIESFAHHVPVLAASIGGIPEMIVPGRNGLLANLSGAEQVASALRSVAADPQSIRDMSTTTVGASKRFLDPALQLDRWEAVLGEVMGQG